MSEDVAREVVDVARLELERLPEGSRLLRLFVLAHKSLSRCSLVGGEREVFCAKGPGRFSGQLEPPPPVCFFSVLCRWQASPGGVQLAERTQRRDRRISKNRARVNERF